MKAKILITSLLAICSSMVWAQSINCFVQGTEWTFNVSNIYYPDYMMKHILDGKVQIGDKEWLKLWVENEDDLGKKKQKGYISTEGERVYYHRDEEDVEGSLLYDFGLGIGDTIVVPAIYTDWDITMKCVGKKTVMSCGHTYDVQLMATMNTEATEDYDLGQWYYGIGEIDYDSEYGNWGHGISMVGNNSKILQQVICNGETIFDCNDVTETSISLPASDPISSVIYNLDGTRHTGSAHGLRVENGHVVWR